MVSKRSEIQKSRGVSGTDLLNVPLLNKGTAFTEAERKQLGLEGLLPPHVETLDEQAARAYEAYKRKGDDLERHIYLRALQDTNEVLFYRLLLDHIEENDSDRLHTDRWTRMPAVQPHLPATAWLLHPTRIKAIFGTWLFKIATAVGLEAQRAGVAPETTEEDLRQRVISTQWTPDYPR